MEDYETEVLTDYRGFAVRLTGERREHILMHPEMVGQFDRIRETLCVPEVVVASAADPSVRVYHRYYTTTPVTAKFLLVVVKGLADDAFVLTAFFSRREKRGRILWRT